MIRKYYQRISRRVAELAGHCRIIILPGVPHTELPGLYRCATAFAFPSLVENCPNALLEAMSAGLPMVVVSRDPMPEFAGDAALFFDPHSPQELARCLGNLLEDESLRERLGRLAVERAGRYRWDDLVRGAVGAYSEACSAVGRPT
jgi:glycosyltransferase involved in cell wall biosynthesis